MRSYPRSRSMAEAVREVVSRLLLEEIADPRLDLVTITGVEVSPDLRHANIFVATHGGEESTTAAMQGLDSAKGRIRSLLGGQVRARFVPELHFRIDPAIEEATRIAEAIKRERELGRAGNDSELDIDAGAEATETAGDV